MTVTFSQGQFFHPRYGWFDKGPELPDYAHRSGFVIEKIGPEHMMTPDRPLYEVSQKITQSMIDQPTYELSCHVPELRTIRGYKPGSDPATTTEYVEVSTYGQARSFISETVLRVKAENGDTAAAEMLASMQKAATNTESPADVYEQRDLSYYLDGSTKFAGSYRFEYKDNTMTAHVDFMPRGSDSIDVVAHYEEHRANIQNLKKQGFHYDTVHMLMDALNEAFVNAKSGGFEGRLLHYNRNMSSAQLKHVVKSFYEEYLRVRDSAGSVINAMTAAGNTLKRQGLFDARFDVTTPETEHIAASPELQKKMAEAVFTPLDPSAIKDTTTWDPADTHIRSLNRYVDYSKNTTMSDIEKEARSLSIVFRVRGDQMLDYAHRYEDIMGQLDSKLSNGEISQEHYDRYRTDLDTAFIKTHNLNIKGQAEAAGLSEAKATELAETFSKEYIQLRVQASPDEIDAEKIANTVLQSLASQGWPEFSLHSSENRATVAKDDPWYAMMSEDALYWRSKPQPYEYC